MKDILIKLLILSSLATIADAKSSKEDKAAKALFDANCLACHQPAQSKIAPSLYEINQRYKNNPEGIVNWAIKPGRRKKEGLVMPSMAHVGEDNLALIAKYMLKVGAKTRKPRKAKPSFQEKLSSVQRCFMPNSGPASIAVSLTENLSYCWDTDRCSLRYFWKGKLIPGSHFTSNGKSLPKLSNPPFYTFTSSPFGELAKDRDFIGYDIDDLGMPEFSYRLGNYQIRERLEFIEDEIIWTYKIQGSKGLRYNLPKIENFDIISTHGQRDGDQLILSVEDLKVFSIHIKEVTK